jgi:lysophospholipase L1-like esterase
MTPSTIPSISFLSALSILTLAFGCSTAASDDDSGGGHGGTAGTLSTGGTPGSGGSSAGASSGGTGNQAGHPSTMGTGGASSGGSAQSTGGSAQSTGGSPTGTGGAGTGGAAAGTGNHAGSGAGGSAAGGGAGSGASAGVGGAAAGGGGMSATAGAAGMGAAGMGAAGTGSGGFDPCPATDPCKILPLGDSITWGINYGGGYRIKLFIHTSTDMKKVTFVGYDKANPPTSSVLTGLGSAMSAWTPNHEGHSGWTIQQDDDLVTGKSTATNDSVSYTGKKVVADFNPNIVLVHLGTNDMYQTPTGAPDRLGTLIDDIVKDAPNALVVVASIIPFPSGASAVTTFNKAVPGEVKTRADAGKHVIFVDMFSALTTSDLGSDMIHPNEGGYEKMAVAWYTAIKPYLH